MTETNGDALRKWLPALVVICGLAVSWGTFQTQLNVMADEVAELKEENDAHDARETVDKAEIAVLKTNQQAIKEDVAEIKEEQKEFKKETNEKLDKILEELRERN